MKPRSVFVALGGMALAVLSASLATPAEAQSGPYQFSPLSPCRVVDTREAAYAPALVGQGTPRGPSRSRAPRRSETH